MVERVIQVAPGHHQVFCPEPGVTLELIHSGTGFQVFLVEVQPNTRSQPAAHDGEEVRYVLEGNVVFRVADREYYVPAGGSLRHPSSVAHGFHTSGEVARFVTFALSRDYDIRTLFRGTAEGES